LLSGKIARIGRISFKFRTILMEISFATEALKEICLRRKLPTDSPPPDVLSAMHTLYLALRSAETIGELPLKPAVQREGNGLVEWMFDLADGYMAVLRPNHQKPPAVEEVYRVLLVDIEGPK